MAAERQEFHLSIGSAFENIDLVQVVLDDSLIGLGVADDTRHWIDLAVREAVANAIKHGNQHDAAKRVKIAFAVEGDEVVIRVRDEGRGFDPEVQADPLAAENLLRPSGRGLLYMKSFMDGVDYHAHPQGGTEVVLRKRITGGDRTANG